MIIDVIVQNILELNTQVKENLATRGIPPSSPAVPPCISTRAVLFVNFTNTVLFFFYLQLF